LALLLNAPWGGGKTTFMHLVEKELQNRYGWLCLWFNAWEYQRLDLPWWGIYQTILRGLCSLHSGY
jgi:predicted KAP-like P-loop ATPase